MRSSLRTRLLAAIALVVALSLGISLVVGTALVRRSVERENLADLALTAELLALREEQALIAGVQLRTVGEALAQRGVTLQLLPLREAGDVVPQEMLPALRRGGTLRGSLTFGGDELLFAARRVSDKVLVLSRPAGLQPGDWRPFLDALLIAAAIGAALAAIASFLLARAIARPVRAVAEASRSLAAGAAPEPIPVGGSDELASLASSFNDMATQLARARQAEQSFLLSVSHELKTPLTAIRGYSEALSEGAVAPEEAAQVVSREAGRLERLVQDLLDLGRMQRSRFSVRRERVDLAESAAEATRRFEPQAAAFGVSLSLDAPGPAQADGDPDRVLQVLSNLIENALRVTPTGGSVAVAVRPGAVTVRDTGPGLEPDDLPRAFDRFFLWARYASERKVGTGLGLAIVKELTEAMGGAVTVESTPGAGTSFTISLPPGSPVPDDGAAGVDMGAKVTNVR